MTSTFSIPSKIGQIFSENIDDLIFIIDEKYQCEYVNFQEFIKIKGINEFIHPEDFKRVIKLLKNLFKNGSGIEEAQIKYPGEPYRWFEIKGRSFVDNEDSRKKAFLICRDITKFKEIEFEFKRSQKKYSELIDSLPEIRYWKLLQSKEGITTVQKTREMLDLVIDTIPQLIYWKDTNLIYLGCNSNFAIQNGFKDPSNIIGKSDNELKWLLTKLEYIQNCERNVMRYDKPEYNVIESLITADGNHVWFQINRIPLHNEKRKVVGILATYEDITIRKTSEQKLKESEEKYRSILDNIKESYFEVDLKGNFTFFNDALSELQGTPEDELFGMNYQNFVDEENKKKIFDVYRNVYETEQPELDFQYQFRNKNGDLVTCESSVYLRYDSDRKKIGFSGLARDITEKFHLEQKLKESEEKFRHLFESSPYAIWLMDLDGTIIDCNSTMKHLLSAYETEDLIGKKFTEVLSIIKRPEFLIRILKERFAKFLKGEKLDPLEFEITRFDEKKLWLEIQSSLVKVGNKTLIQALIQDITDKKVAEQKLRESQEELKILNKELEQNVLERSKDLIESEQQYRTTIDSLNDPLHVVDKDLKIILVNKEFKRWLSELNIEPDIFDKKIFEVFPFLPREVYEEYKKVFDTGTPLITMETTPLLDRNIITETRKIPIFSEGKVKQVITIIRDVTESKEMQDQLEESEENFRNMITNLDEGYYKVEMDGKILYHNPAFCKIAGYDRTENLIGKQQPLYWRNLEDREDYIGELLEKGFIRNYITSVKKKDGDEIVVQVNAHLIKDDNGKPIAIEGTFSDITEKFRLEQDLMESEKILRQQNIELKKLDKVKNDFITMAAHELKTPLISISGYTDYILMKHRSQLNLEITQDLITVQRNVNRLEVLMDQLLDVLKIDEEELKLQKELTNVSRIINDCIDELSYLINEKNLEIILNIDREIILDLDPTRIFAVFTNLISNAIKFTPDYGWIEISAKKEHNQYVFEVKDNGIGLAEDEIQRLFKKFERIKPPILNEHINIKDSGTGLGLYITKGIINAHGGKIWAISEGENKGSTFSFTLPI
ncbi:MAG: PAS domain S-box protein [Promethearchaeota archaeon]|nr:MAG: PAS domain S-box protein [Candidatus Lokiarchaeota archaeon]